MRLWVRIDDNVSITKLQTFNFQPFKSSSDNHRLTWREHEITLEIRRCFQLGSSLVIRNGVRGGKMVIFDLKEKP